MYSSHHGTGGTAWQGEPRRGKAPHGAGDWQTSGVRVPDAHAGLVSARLARARPVMGGLGKAEARHGHGGWLAVTRVRDPGTRARRDWAGPNRARHGTARPGLTRAPPGRLAGTQVRALSVHARLGATPLGQARLASASQGMGTTHESAPVRVPARPGQSTRRTPRDRLPTDHHGHRRAAHAL